MGLFEQGILDREAIQFLFELGFVPSSTVDSRGLLTTTGTNGITAATESAPACASTNTSNRGRPNNMTIVTNDDNPSDVDYDDQQIEASITTTKRTTEMTRTTEVAIASPTNVLHNVNSAVPGVTTLHSKQTLRSLEASAIRRKLSQHDNLRNDSMKKKNKKKNTKPTPANGEQSSPVENDNDKRPKPWDVAHFPLSMSRYQREFKEIALLSSGSFGSVFRAVRELDGYEYAVKKIKFDAMGYSKESIEKVIREVQCLAAVNDHPNIVRYYTSWWEPTWMTGSISSKNRHISASGTSSSYRKYIVNGSSTNSVYSRSGGINRKTLQIDAGSTNNESVDLRRRIDDATEEWAAVSSSSSSSSWSSDSDDDYYSLDGGIGSIGEDTWESYHSHNVEQWTEAYDDSYITKTAYRRRRRSTRKAMKNIPNATPYQYQISLYIQMQLCHPANLQDWIRERNKQIPESDHERRIGPAVEIFQQICSGLAHIHKSNVVHRDLKPANIFVSSDGKVIKIGDFGLSKQLRDIVNHQHTGTFNSKPSSPHQRPPSEKKSVKTAETQRNNDAIISIRADVSSTQALVEYNKVDDNLTSGIGTASYAAPEQVQSKTYGTAVDIFSLGLIFLELVSCFETEHERLHNLQQCRYQRLPEWIDDNYPDIFSTILACTRPNACDRPTANKLIDVAKIKSPRNQKEVHLLKRQLSEKNEEIAEKNETIKIMRLEMERMRALLVPNIGPYSRQNGDELLSVESQGEAVVVTDIVTFQDDIEYLQMNK